MTRGEQACEPLASGHAAPQAIIKSKIMTTNKNTVRRPDTIRLGFWHQTTVYGATALLVVSGALWLLLHFFMVNQGEFGDTHHPLETWMLKLHGAAAMAGLIIYGSLLPIHIRRAWAIRRNIVLGISLVVLMLLLTVTGYLLYYAGGEEARPIISATHWILGVGVPALLAWHVLSGKRRSRRASGVEIISPIL